MDTDGTDDAAPERDLSDRLGFARAHADTPDTRQRVSDLEDMLRVAPGLMAPEQRAAFRDHPDLPEIEDAVGGRGRRRPDTPPRGPSGGTRSPVPGGTDDTGPVGGMGG